MNPLIIEGTRLLAPAIVHAAKSIPAAQLARFGLLRGPLVGLGPVTGAFVGGAVLTALMVPGSRAWLAERATNAVRWARERLQTDEASEGARPAETNDGALDDSASEVSLQAI